LAKWIVPIESENSKALIILLTRSLYEIQSPISLQRKTPLRTIRIIPPPVRHRNNLACPKEQENQQHIEIKPSITRRSQDEVIPSPKTISISEGPVHDNKAANEGG